MKHLLFFAGYRMVVLRWHADAFTGMAEFEPDERGFAAFEKLLHSEITKPVKMLIDIIEEDIRLDTAPHLLGRDRKAFHNRLLNKYFRQYSHTLLQIQGRQSGGRRDDNVLLMALTNSKLFQPWLDILGKAKKPLEGIYSLPLAGEELLKILNATEQNALVISQHVPSSVRQSFYENGRLKLSRLVPSGDEAGSQYEVLRDEVIRTVRYLENQYNIDTQQSLHIYIIAPGHEHNAIQAAMKPDNRKEFHLIDRDQIAYQVGIKGLLPGPYSYWLFAHLLLSGKFRKPLYTNHADQRYYYHYLAKAGMYAASTVAMLGIVLWGASQLIDGYMLSAKTTQKEKEAVVYQRQYEEIVKDISDLDLDVEDVRSAVNLADTLQQRYRSTPLDFFQIVSKTLTRHPHIEIRKMDWVQTHNQSHSFGERQPELDPRTARYVKLGRLGFLYSKSLIEAAVSDYDQNPRIALEKMSSFIDDLQAEQDLYSVEVIKMPFDIDPSSRFIGETGGSDSGEDDAKFAFVLSKEIQL